MNRHKSWDAIFEFPQPFLPHPTMELDSINESVLYNIPPVSILCSSFCTFKSLSNYRKKNYFLQKLPEEDLTFESMKKVLTESSEVRREAEAEKREQINHTFRTAPFAELVKRTQPKVVMNYIAII